METQGELPMPWSFSYLNNALPEEPQKSGTSPPALKSPLRKPTWLNCITRSGLTLPFGLTMTALTFAESFRTMSPAYNWEPSLAGLESSV